MGNEIVPVSNFEEVTKIAGAMVKSGYFQDARDVSQAIVKILAGAEIGIGAFQSMQSIYIIQGRPSMSANLMASRVKASRRYNYRIVTLDDSTCDILFLEDGKEAGHSVFTRKDAEKAGTKNLDKFPRNMLFARAMSNGVRWYCPDVLGSAPFYTPEELGADVAEDGTVIDLKPISERPVVAQETQNIVQKHEENDELRVHENTIKVPVLSYEDACNVTNRDGIRYGDIDPEKLSIMSASLVKSIRAGGTPEEISEKQYKLAAIKAILEHKPE